ncbi:GNAT family N-acetyltransferase [Rothia sp. AR01]|uniref:GNAT family N-acetyltransferase n=1 Tax=Rothia santali TaxID=2949643 RepID=A0A9X2KJ36_9MICC|nr:GNAT family N-acetyltransferase [Rothia santali]MCP3426459.1 GNAT family N-acetyltransferase [Rothia santali]
MTSSDIHSIRRAHWADLSPRTAYALIRLRLEVYVVEQGITEQELDGRELESGSELFWVEAEGLPVSTIRVLEEAPGLRSIGRVATGVEHRGQGLAGALLREAIAAYGSQDIALHAQAYLEEWYGRFGFIRSGAPDMEAGIPHVPMLRPGVGV